MTHRLADDIAAAICERRNASDWPCNGLDFDAEMARVALKAIRDAGVMLVPVTVVAAAPKLTWDALRAGMVVRMRRSGIRRITQIEPNRYGTDQQWATVHWMRLDEGRYRGKTGWQSAAYFARDVAEVIEVAA